MKNIVKFYKNWYTKKEKLVYQFFYKEEKILENENLENVNEEALVEAEKNNLSTPFLKKSINV